MKWYKRETFSEGLTGLPINGVYTVQLALRLFDSTA